MLQSVRPTFRLYLEKPQPHGPCAHPTDLWVADYRQGERPELDSLRDVRVLVDSSSDESLPVPLPDGDLAYHSNRGRAGIYRLRGGPVLLRPRIGRFAVSPDGQDWAFVSDGKLYRHRPGEAPREVALPGHAPGEVLFRPDGELLFVDRTGLYRAEGPELLAEGEFRDVAFSRDGSRFVYLRGDADGDQLRVREVEGEDRLLRHSASEPRVCDYPLYSRPKFSPDGTRILYCVASLDGTWGPTAQSDLRVLPAAGGEPTILCDDVLSAA